MTAPANVRIGPAEIAALETHDRNLDTAISSGDIRGYLVHNYRFHQGVYASAGAPILWETANRLWLRFGPSLRVVGGRFAVEAHIVLSARRAAAARAAALEGFVADAVARVVAVAVAQGRHRGAVDAGAVVHLDPRLARVPVHLEVVVLAAEVLEFDHPADLVLLVRPADGVFVVQRAHLARLAVERDSDVAVLALRDSREADGRRDHELAVFVCFVDDDVAICRSDNLGDGDLVSRIARERLVIDRHRPVTFRFNGKTCQGFEGDTLASALLANGHVMVGRSFKYHRPRGIIASGAEEPNALMGVGEGARFEPNQRATTTELHDGMVARSQNHWPSLDRDIGAVNAWVADKIPVFSAGFYYKTFLFPRIAWKHLYEPVIRQSAGLGPAPTEADPDEYEHFYAYTDVLVVGAGQAGLTAARAAAARR